MFEDNAMMSMEEELKKLSEQSDVEDQQDDVNRDESIEDEEPLEDDVNDSDDLEEDQEGEEEPEEEQEQPKKSKSNEAFARMRHESKEKDAQIQELREMVAKIQGAQEAMYSAKPKEEEPNDAEPDKNLYPEEWMEWKSKKLEESQAELKQTTASLEDQIKIQNEINAVNTLESNYKNQNKDSDYEGALQFVMNQEALKIKAFYPNATDEQIKAHLENEKMEMFRSNPHGATKAIVDIATAGGYKAGGVKKKKSNISNLKKNIDRHTNVMGGSDARDSSEITPEQVFDMSMDELSRMKPEAWNSAMNVTKRRK